MAAYAATVALDFPKPAQLGNTPMGVLSGTCNITNYNQTLAELTVITKAYLPSGLLRVVPDGVSSLGYIIKWDTTGKSFKVFTGTVGALAQLASDTNVGTFDFIAVGQL